MPAADLRRTTTIGRRLGAVPLAAHAAALAMVLLALVPVLGRDALFSADEGAAVAQARLLSEARGWALEHPLPALEPEGAHFPLENATPLERPDGDPASAPFAKHPAYAVMLAPLDAAGGVLAMTLASVAGTVLAAFVAGLLCRRLSADLAWLAVWAAGLATPLFVDGWLVIAHTLGAALVAVATLAAVRVHEGRGGPAVLAAGAAMAGATLLRNEATLFGVALAVAVGVLAWRSRRPALAAAGLAVLAGTVLGHLLDRALLAAVAGGSPAPFSAGAAQSGFLAGRVLGAVVTLVLPSYGDLGLTDGLLVVAAGAGAAAVIVARRRPEDGDGIRLLACLGALAAVLRAALEPSVAPGLLVAAPLLLAGLAALRGATFRTAESRLLGLTTLLFAGGVLATQYASGGSGEWGGRYFALALPLAVPLAIVALRDAAGGVQPAVRRTLVASLAVTAVAVSVLGARSLRATEDRATHLVASIDDAAAAFDDPVVVSTAGAAPRFAWAQVLSGEPWLLVPPDDLAATLDRLRRDGRDVVLATPEPDRDRLPGATGRPVGGGSSWVVLTRSGD